ncbi:aldo/keto reductase [Salipiger sp.]|uniref:aldo/keto reductase n=1 Tax=Salipiger sp. TaxID=2078585 RepID=UPI003A97A92F
MKTRVLGRTGLNVPPIALGGAAFSYVHETAGWNPRSDEGRKIVHRTLNTALDNGMTYFDTAPAYGEGYSETLFGEVMKTRRNDCILASKVWYELDGKAVTQSIEDSLTRLRCEHIDVMQIHGRMYTPAEIAHIDAEVLPALIRARDAGKIGHIGITSEEPFCLLPFLADPEIEVFQIAYNLIYQAAARHFLIEAEKVNAGVVTMRTMTSGVFQMEMQHIAPGMAEAFDLYEACLRFTLSDSRVHVGILGARWPEEVLENIRIAEQWVPPFDFADMPRLTFKIYEAQDKG